MNSVSKFVKTPPPTIVRRFKPPLPRDSETWTRHLHYHIWPVKGNGTWQRNLDMLKPRLGLFNGHRAVAIVTDHATDSPEMVMDYFGPEADFIIMPNSPAKRETLTWHPLWRQLRMYRGKRDVTFCAHAKGVRHATTPDVSVHRWADLMYESCLDYWPIVERLLETKAIVGGMKKSRIVYFPGTFYWVRNDDKFNAPNVPLPKRFDGTEEWTKIRFTSAEAGVVFCELGRLNLYSVDYIAGLEKRFEKWKSEHTSDRTDIGSLTTSSTV